MIANLTPPIPSVRFSLALKLSKRTEYGLRAVVQLARHYPAGSYVQSRDLAKEEGLPTKFLEAILLVLRQEDFLESKVGLGGGYKLKRPPRDILIGDLVKSLEAPPAVKEHAGPSDDLALGEIATRLINRKISDATDAALGQMTLEQLMEQVARAGSVGQAMYYI
jgi:Rrf2 family protein